MWQIAEEYTPQQRTGAYTQAMMDLGATLCTRSKPLCAICPVADGCQARRLDLIGRLPEPKPRKTLPIKQSYLLLLQSVEGRILLERRPPSGIWGGLWSLPEFADKTAMENWCAERGYRIGDLLPLPQRRHTFSHYRLDYTPLLATLNTIIGIGEPGAYAWHGRAEWPKLGLPAPVRQLLHELTVD